MYLGGPPCCSKCFSKGLHNNKSIGSDFALAPKETKHDQNQWCSSLLMYPDSKVHGASHLGPTGPRWAPCGPHGNCYLGIYASPCLDGLIPTTCAYVCYGYIWNVVGIYEMQPGCYIALSIIAQHWIQRDKDHRTLHILHWKGSLHERNLAWFRVLGEWNADLVTMGRWRT